MAKTIEKCPLGYRIVPSANWWKPGLNLQQDQFDGAELVSLANTFAPGSYYQKYAVRLKNGREIIFGTRVTDIVSMIGKGEGLIDWAVNEALSDCLGVPTLRGLETINGQTYQQEVQGSWRRIEAAQKRLQNHALTIDTSKARIQPWAEYCAQELLDIHRASFSARFDKRDKAAELGTRAHNLIDLWIRHLDLQELDEHGPTIKTVVYEEGGKYYQINVADEPTEVYNALAACRDFWVGNKLQPIATEQFLADIQNGVAGTVDCVARTASGDIVIPDWKTSSGVYAGHLLQIGAYAHMWGLCNPNTPKPERGYIVRLDKKTAQLQVVPACHNASELHALIADWIAAIMLFRWVREADKYLKNFKPEWEE